MKVGVKKMSELGGNWSPNHHLDTCVHCGGQEHDPGHHDEHGRCHHLVRVYKRNGHHSAWRRT